MYIQNRTCKEFKSVEILRGEVRQVVVRSCVIFVIILYVHVYVYHVTRYCKNQVLGGTFVRGHVNILNFFFCFGIKMTNIH